MEVIVVVVALTILRPDRIATMSDAQISQNDKDLSGGLVPSRLRDALENDELALFC
jgi:hypothetical protein